MASSFGLSRSQKTDTAMDWYNVLKQVNDGYGSAQSMRGNSDGVSKLGGIMSLISSIGSLFA